MSNIIQDEKQTFKHALITSVELKNGKSTEIIVVFNHSEIGVEELNLGINKALEYSHNVKSMQSSFFRIKDGIRDAVFSFEKTYIKEYRPELDPELKHHY